MVYIIILVLFGFLLRMSYGVISPYRDSGDLVASAYSLGIAHPPGYAFYTVLTKLGMWVFPLGNPAYQTHFFSALWTSITVGIIFKILQKWVDWPAALIAMSVWFFSASVIHLSMVSEMYTLNGLFCAILFYFAVLYDEKTGFVLNDFLSSTKYFVLIFFLIGLGFLNHPTIIFLLPGLILFWFYKNKMRPIHFQVRSWFIFLFFGFLGLSLILFYPIRSFQEPWIDWGNPEGFRSLWRLMTRSDYGGLKLHPGESQLNWNFFGVVQQILFFVRTEYSELKLWGCFLFLLGLGVGVKNKVSKGMYLLWGICFIFSGPVFFILSNLPIQSETSLPILEPYLLMTNLFVLLWIAIAIQWIVQKLSQYLRPFLIQTMAVSLIFVQSLFCSQQFSERNSFYAYDYGKNILKTMELHSSIYEPDDTTAFVLYYFQTVEHFRRDIVPLIGLKTFWGYEQFKKRYPQIMPQGEFGSAQVFIPALLQYHQKIQRALYSDHSSKFSNSLSSFPKGILVKTGNLGSIENFKLEQTIFNFYVERPGSRGVFIDRHHEFFVRHLLSRFSAALNNIGIIYQNYKQYSTAEVYIYKALVREPGLSAAWNNLGINYYLQNDFARAEKVYLEGIQKCADKLLLNYHLALTQIQMNENEKARKSLENVLRLDPQYVPAMNEMGLLFLRSRKWVEARDWFEKALLLNPSYAPAHYNLGLIYQELKMNLKSAESFTHYLRYSPAAQDSAQVSNWILQLKNKN